MARTRLAPSPTGALHLGNARTFLINWALARQRDWTIVLRIDDLDGPRVKPAAAAEAIADLQWLGVDWDEGPIYQRSEIEPYRQALRKLVHDGYAYPCDCTRAQVQAATLSAPHGDQHELRYPGTCRPKPDSMPRQGSLGDADFTRAWRMIAPNHPVIVDDRFCGSSEFDLQATIGDFLVWTKQGFPSYQLAVVVDDSRQSIDQVVRGDDLLSSAARQQVIYDRLRLGNYPAYTHVPLVLGSDGRRLAKRHGDTRISKYRESGVRAERLIGLVARWSGLPDANEMTAGEFLHAFHLTTLPQQPVAFAASDERWLTNP